MVSDESRVVSYKLAKRSSTNSMADLSKIQKTKQFVPNKRNFNLFTL
ncbi:MAG: hypothetical protein LBC74_13480 [Planctomycetaceae bacterium]|nr:hypothetical protein [Planctomycetaceae bacterium]